MKAQWITFAIALCTAVAAQATTLPVPEAVIRWILFAAVVASAALPSLLAKPDDKQSKLPSGTGTGLCVFLALMLSGCGVLKSASDEVASLCEGYMAAQPEVQAQAQKKAVSPLVIAEAICLANSAGRQIWELFQVREPEPGKMMTVKPDEQLERAKDQALAVARRQGLLP